MGKKNTNKSDTKIPESNIQLLIAKLGFQGALITALIGALATALVAYFGYLGIRSQISIPIVATQTAESKITLTPPILFTSTSVPTLSLEPITTTSPTSYPNLNAIAITEVMANPCGPAGGIGETYWNEYVELYNYGKSPIDVGGWWITDGEDVEGNPDRLISWNERYPSQKFGSNITDTTTIGPGQYALILSPQYLRSKSFEVPYTIAPGTLILTIENGSYIGDEGGGLQITDTLDVVVLYVGTDEYIDQVISTYGSPKLGASPKNIKDNPSDRDGIPLVLGDCYSAERKEAEGPDAEYNWDAIEGGTPGWGSYSP
jgi:hypothetical protein